MAWMSGVVKKEITKHRRPIEGPRRLIFHTAVSKTDSLFGYFSSVSDCSHWYVRKDGTIEQYVSTDYQAPAQREGNHDSLSVESWDGYGETWRQGDPVPPWTPQQVEANARIAAWAHIERGIPLRLIPDSVSGREGIGYHRLGCDPWRVNGGELWSSSYGKVCPGPSRILQVPEIIKRAEELVVALSPEVEKFVTTIYQAVKEGYRWTPDGWTKGAAESSDATIFGPWVDLYKAGILTKENHSDSGGGVSQATFNEHVNSPGAHSHNHQPGRTGPPLAP